MTHLKHYTHYLLDWGNTLMQDLPGQEGPMVSWPEVAIVPGAVALLRELANKGKCYIATNAENSSALQIRQALQRVGMDVFINDIFCFREIGFKKPDAEYFAAVLDKLNCTGDSVVMIGDSLENDVRGALNAGIDAIWLNLHHAPCPPGIRAVHDLHELSGNL